MTRPEFEKLVRRSVGKLPPHIRRRMARQNLIIVVERRPTTAKLLSLNMNPATESLFGLYEGIPLTERTSWYNFALPDKITIYQEPLEEAYPNELTLKEQVRRTVFHEIAHFFGMTDAELEAMGW